MLRTFFQSLALVEYHKEFDGFNLLFIVDKYKNNEIVFIK